MSAKDLFSDWDAAYVLGALSPADRHEFERHLAGCDSCSSAVAELAGMPGLLSAVKHDDAERLLEPQAPETVPSTLLPRLVRSARRRTRRVRSLVAGGIVAAAAAAAAIVLVLPAVVPHPVPTVSTPAGRVVALAPVIPNPLSANITLTSETWGTRIEMNCHYGAPPTSMPTPAYTEGASLGYSLYVTDKSGNAIEVATWWAKPGTTAEPSGTTSLAVSQIASIDVRATDGTVLLKAEP